MMDAENLQNETEIIKSEDPFESYVPIKLEVDNFLKTELDVNHDEVIIKDEQLDGVSLKIEPKTELDNNCLFKCDTIHNCTQCDFTTYYKDSLQSHTLSHLTETARNSNPAYTNTDNLSETAVSVYNQRLSELKFQNHLLNQLPQKLKIAEKGIALKNLLQHNHNRFQCGSCDYTTYTKEYLRQHMRRHLLKGNEYKCSQCDFKTVYKGNFRVHLKKHSKNSSNLRQYKCPQCQFSSIYKGNLKSHLITHASKELSSSQYGFECYHCGFKTAYRRSLVTHISKHRKEYKYKCEKCDYVTFYKPYVTQHMKRHLSSTKDYKCPLCDFRTRKKTNLRKHSLIHLANNESVA